MDKQALNHAEFEAREFLWRVSAIKSRPADVSEETLAALKRQSMELTRSLAKLRRSQ